MRTEIEYSDAIEAPSASWWLFDTQSRQNMFSGLAEPYGRRARQYRALGRLDFGLLESKSVRGQDDMRSDADNAEFHLRASD